MPSMRNRNYNSVACLFLFLHLFAVGVPRTSAVEAVLKLNKRAADRLPVYVRSLVLRADSSLLQLDSSSPTTHSQPSGSLSRSDNSSTSQVQAAFQFVTSREDSLLKMYTGSRIYDRLELALKIATGMMMGSCLLVLFFRQQELAPPCSQTPPGVDCSAAKSSTASSSLSSQSQQIADADIEGLAAVGMLSTIVALGWAFIAGVLITLQARFAVQLSQHSEDSRINSLVVPIAIQALALPLLSLSFLRGPPTQRAPAFSYFAGMSTLLAFACLVAAEAYGFAITMILSMLGSLTAALLIDYSETGVFSVQRGLGTTLTFLGALLICYGRSLSINVSDNLHYVQTVCLFLVLINGAGYCVQSRCTSELKRYSGSPFRAAFICNLVYVVASTPLLYIVGARLHVRAADWHLWAFCVAQNIFHTASVSVIPNLISYSSTFTTIQSGMLVSAAIVDYSETGLRFNIKLAISLLGMLAALGGSAVCAFVATATPTASSATEEPNAEPMALEQTSG